MKTFLLSIALIPVSLANAQNVYIPDLYFKSYLLNNAAINTNFDSEIQVSEAIAFNGGIYCSLYGISDFTGIEAFTGLTYLDCHANYLTSLDVSNNTALTYLNCQDNDIASLDLSNNTALNELNCRGNQLTSLDVSNNTALTVFLLEANQLTSLNVSNNTALTNLTCGYNNLFCLNVKNGNNNALTSLIAVNNPNLTCIEVDDVAYSTANWTNIDSQTSFSTYCNNACSNTTGLDELSKTPLHIVKTTDIIGRETEDKPNTLLIYIYSDGTTEKVFRVE